MKVLLDECLPHTLKSAIIGHQVMTVPEAGWAGKQNGELLKFAETQFEVFITVDQNLPAQQNLASKKLSVVVLKTVSNRFKDIEPAITRLLEVLNSIERGAVVVVEAGSSQ